MAETIRSYEVYTSGAGQRVLAGVPVRLAVTGSNHGRVARATFGEDAAVIGIARGPVLTLGFGVPVLVGNMDPFQGSVNTTVAAGAKVRCGPGGVFQGIATGTRYCAVVLQARTNTGLCWLAFCPRGF